MNPNMKRMLITNRRRRKDGTFMNYPGVYNDRSGSRGIDPDGYTYPIYPSTAYWGDPEDRFRDRRGREHYDNGRYAPMSAYYDDMEDAYPMPPIYPTVPPIYTMEDGWGAHHDSDRRGLPMNRIGFAVPEDNPKRYRSHVPYPSMHETEYRKSPMQKGWADSMELEPITKELALEWVSDMKNSDGTTGPHWSMEQAKQAMEQQKIDCDPIEFFVALNMMYSDYYRVAKKFNCSNIEFYACMAKAFLDDKDAHPDKLARYYDAIVK